MGWQREVERPDDDSQQSGTKRIPDTLKPRKKERSARRQRWTRQERYTSQSKEIGTESKADGESKAPVAATKGAGERRLRDRQTKTETYHDRNYLA